MGNTCKAHLSLTAVRGRVRVGLKEILHHLGNSVWTFNADRLRGGLEVHLVLA